MEERFDTTLLQTKKILVVDDSKMDHYLTKKYLERLGVADENIVMVHGSIEAVDLAQQELFDLIFMDIHLSEINGIEASQRIKAASSGGKQPKIIAYTANQFIQKEPAALETFDGFLIKPVSIEAFSDEIVKVFTMDKQGN